MLLETCHVASFSFLHDVSLPREPCIRPTRYQPRRLLDILQDQLKGNSKAFPSVKLSFPSRADKSSWMSHLVLFTFKYQSWYSITAYVQYQSPYAKGLTHSNCSPKCLCSQCKTNEYINNIKSRLFSNSLVFLFPMCGHYNSREGLTHQNNVDIALMNTV